jgi:hypothetical protein
VDPATTVKAGPAYSAPVLEPRAKHWSRLTRTAVLRCRSC